MTHTTFAILSILSANVFLYILFIATPYFSTADTYMGVFLDHAYRKSPEAKKIFKHFILFTTIVFVMITIILLLLSINIPTLNNSPLLAIAFLVETLLYFLIYGNAYTQTKAYKKSLNLPEQIGRAHF